MRFSEEIDTMSNYFFFHFFFQQPSDCADNRKKYASVVLISRKSTWQPALWDPDEQYAMSKLMLSDRDQIVGKLSSWS